MQSDNYKSTKKSSSKTSKSETTELIRPGKPYDEFTFDEFIPIGIVHCADCGVVMPGNQLETEDFGKNKIKTYFKNVSHRCMYL